MCFVLPAEVSLTECRRLHKDDNNENAVKPEVIKDEPETKEVEETPPETVKEVQDTEYAALIAGNLTKEEPAVRSGIWAAGDTGTGLPEP